MRYSWDTATAGNPFVKVWFLCAKRWIWLVAEIAPKLIFSLQKF